MKLYKATYDIIFDNRPTSTKIPIYIVAPDFETATKLAETNEKINPVLKSGGNPASCLTGVELIALSIVSAQ